MNRLTLSSLGVLVTLGVAACGGDDDGASSPTVATTPPSTPADGGGSAGTIDGEFNDADVIFAQDMIPHHEQAIEMADVALDPARAAGPDVVDLATRIEEAQGPEIADMTAMLEAWDAAPTTDDGHEMGSMEGGMSDERMGMLESASREEFDRMWMEMMIEHHGGAIRMAQAVLENGTNPTAAELADAIITAQRAEIVQMSQLLES